MRPIITKKSNFVWLGPTPEVGDLHAQVIVEENVTITTWQPDDIERAIIAKGGNVELRVWGRHPPVAVKVNREVGVGEDDPTVRARLENFRSRVVLVQREIDKR